MVDRIFIPIVFFGLAMFSLFLGYWTQNWYNIGIGAIFGVISLLARYLGVKYGDD